MKERGIINYLMRSNKVIDVPMPTVYQNSDLFDIAHFKRYILILFSTISISFIICLIEFVAYYNYISIL